MLLFSTVLGIRKSLTKEKFIRLVLEWNRKSTFSENVIPGIEWNGEMNARYGSDDLWLDIEEYRNKNIIAVRYEKVERDGVIWDTDYIMHFSEMKMSIRLDRSYKEDAPDVAPDFSTPKFILSLIQNSYIEDDCGFPVTDEPLIVTGSNLRLLTDIAGGSNAYHLPIVYVSKSLDDGDPVDVGRLAYRLKGAAHVLVEEDRELNKRVRKECSGANAYNGAVGIYYQDPELSRRKFLYRNYMDDDSALMDRVVDNVIRHNNSQYVENLYTWPGVRNALLADNLECRSRERLAAEKATDELYDTFDQELKDQAEKIRQLTNENDSLHAENSGLHRKLSRTENVPLLHYGDEDEFYLDEIKNMVLEALGEAAEGAKDNTRKADVLRDIVRKNDHDGKAAARRKEIKGLMRNYDRMNGALRKELQAFGFEITEDGKHYKLTYFGDERYIVAVSKTPSDWRTGKNTVAKIVEKVL